MAEHVVQFWVQAFYNAYCQKIGNLKKDTQQLWYTSDLEKPFSYTCLCSNIVEVVKGTVQMNAHKKKKKISKENQGDALQIAADVEYVFMCKLALSAFLLCICNAHSPEKAHQNDFRRFALMVYKLSDHLDIT